MIYLDNAATTFPKPECVIREMSKCMREYCGNPGRGSHSMALAASSKIYECRALAAQLFSCENPENVVFTMNTTYAINMAVKSLFSGHGHILISSMEHNSVYRPTVKLCNIKGASFDIFDAFADDIISEIKSKIKPNTEMIVCAHASNICNHELPIEKIGRFCVQNGLYFVVDAAQSAGNLDINVEMANITVLCVPGHKGLYGPQGSAMMICGKDFRGSTFVEGGGGINSLDLEMPEFLPERYEGGTLPTPCIAGLGRGIEFVLCETPRAIREKEEYLFSEAYNRLAGDRRFKIYSHKSGPILLINVKNKSPSETGKTLNDLGICVRSGFHCSPLGHESLGTGDDGAVRVSFGFFNRKNDAIKLCDALLSVAKSV